jgi:hypothetical protein
VIIVSVTVDCCSSPRALRTAVESGPAILVQVRVLPVPSMFPSELRSLRSPLPFEIGCAVAPPSVVEAIGVKHPRLGELLLFSNGRLLGRVPPEAADKRQLVLGLLKAGLAPWLGRAPLTEADEIDPFEVIGVPASAAFDEVHAAWRQKLAKYHPDRFMRAGDKIRQLALTETQRINAAFQTIARERAARERS